MGYRAHYASKYDIKLGGGHFNHNYDQIAELLNQAQKGSRLYYEFEDETRWEIDRDELVKFIADYFGGMTKKQLSKEAFEGYTNTDVKNILTEWVQKSDQNHNFIIIKWL